MTEKRSLSGAFLAPIPKAESDGPDVDLLCDDAPVGVVVVGADDVKVLDQISSCLNLKINET